MPQTITLFRFIALYTVLAFAPVLLAVIANACIDPSTPWARHWGAGQDFAFVCWAAMSLIVSARITFKPTA